MRDLVPLIQVVQPSLAKILPAATLKQGQANVAYDHDLTLINEILEARDIAAVYPDKVAKAFCEPETSTAENRRDSGKNDLPLTRVAMMVRV